MLARPGKSRLHGCLELKLGNEVSEGPGDMGPSRTLLPFLNSGC